ncbi:MAG: TonB-dependent receptor plug domain-containing protein, partial [Betaproteobacteria bacterium]|nr:TonB-dependent receptor plug domain-containing protein [Betaproteobacteria bacterium]
MGERHRAALALSLATASLSCGATDLPVDTVVITAVHEDERADAASGEVDSDRLERRPLGRPGDVLEAVPGMVVTQHSGSGKANQYFLRGFNLDHGTDFAISVDGMPINLPSHAHGQGYADLNFLMPELVDHVHYRKGPYYADQGDFSAAGGAQLHLKRSLPTGLAQLSAGSFGYRRALFGGNRDLGGEANVFGALELGTADGPWEHPDQLRKVNALLRYAQGDDRNGL